MTKDRRTATRDLLFCMFNSTKRFALPKRSKMTQKRATHIHFIQSALCMVFTLTTLKSIKIIPWYQLCRLPRTHFLDMMLGASSLSSSLATDSIPRESQRTATHLGTGIWYQGPSDDKKPPGHTHTCVNTFNREPPIVPLLFVLQLSGNYLYWFCTHFPTVDLLTIVDPAVLYCYRSTV